MLCGHYDHLAAATSLLQHGDSVGTPAVPQHVLVGVIPYIYETALGMWQAKTESLY